MKAYELKHWLTRPIKRAIWEGDIHCFYNGDQWLLRINGEERGLDSNILFYHDDWEYTEIDDEFDFLLKVWELRSHYLIDRHSELKNMLDEITKYYTRDTTYDATKRSCEQNSEKR